MSNSPPERAATLRSASVPLAHLPVFIAPDPLHPAQLTVTGRQGTPYKGVRVTLRHSSEADDLARELPAHLLVPPVWETAPPEAHTFAWVNGYLTARRYTLPRGGIFTPARLLHPDALPNPYADDGEKAAFRAGLAAYLSAVHENVARNQPQPPAPIPMPPPLPAPTQAS
ncbi:hypothetical protein [Deinococcus ficus]|uniref:Uncharacterized protein n=1 Tax=Deinococcus ficus TaxID=317577 RepID=A0A221T2Y1_9DEIO|nr:hypothetical protein [Deinococcus ficus]ASN83206.1 hypothetical protein DFI_18580 [Deinococcus ficus]